MSEDMGISRTDAAHLLRRSGFGVDPQQLDELTTLSRTAAVDRVLDISANPSIADCPVDGSDQPNEFVAWANLTNWWLERMRTSPTPIVEKLVLFWHDHFVSSFLKLADMGVLAVQHRTLRTYATGDFHAMAQAIAIDPAMLGYLDNYINVVGKPQENFGRELMELFTLGLDNYAQSDVVAMARAWSGYTLAAPGYRTMEYKPTWHDKSTSTLFGSVRAWTGPEALTEVLKGAKAVPSSRFIAAKLFSCFAYPVEASDPVVTPLADAFRASELDILTLVREIFASEAFWSDRARRALVRSPVEWIVASMQAVGLTTAQMSPATYLDRAGQVLFAHQDVSGWSGGEAWLSTSAAWTKSSFAVAARNKAYAAKLFADLGYKPAGQAVDEAAEAFGIPDISASTRSALEAMHARSKAESYPWLVGANMVFLLLLSPEFQVA